MTPPKVSDHWHTAEAPEAPPAVPHLARTSKPCATARIPARGAGAAAGHRQLLLQAAPRGDDKPLIRIGFTASKKIGNAVLATAPSAGCAALAREVLPLLAQPGWDYVLVARPEATCRAGFKDMLADLAAALRSVHKARP